ncbi:hypothetical protein [Burkholderia ubonensis]|uniref:hypothetical protein n=1 Tax=Burkholderia ubonensis TaxID=101571 RepID=UPI001E4347E5|nr:hypothetical protein [Burkholderia ubonensis]
MLAIRLLASRNSRYDHVTPASVVIATRVPQPRSSTAASSSAAAQLRNCGNCSPGKSKTNFGQSSIGGKFARQKSSIVSARKSVSSKSAITAWHRPDAMLTSVPCSLNRDGKKGVVEAAGACHPRVAHGASGHSHVGLLIHLQVFRRAIFERKTSATKAIRSIHFNAINSGFRIQK